MSIGWVEVPFHLNTQLTDEIAIALMTEFVKANVKNPHGVQLYEVHFQHAIPKNIALYEQYFGCKVRFSQARNQVLMHVSELSRPLKQGDQTLQELLMQQAKALLEKFPYSTLVDQQLQQAILIGLQKNLFQIKHIAEQMNFSVRQLQRHLQKTGQNLSAMYAGDSLHAGYAISERSALEFAGNRHVTRLFRTKCVSACL